MGRVTWPLAGVLLATNGLVDALEGPRGPLAWVDPTAWAIIFIGGSLGWLWLAIDAARGRF